MADEHLQRLRRAWDAGDLAAQTRLLLGRMRSGELSQERVRSLWRLGWQVAGSALGAGEPEPIGLMLEKLLHETQPFQVRVAVAAARSLERLLAHWEATEPDGWRQTAPRACLAATEAWSVALTPEAADAIWDHDCSFSSDPAVLVAEHASSIVTGQGGLEDAVWEAIGATSEEEVRRSFVAEVVPWALGLGDPVAERVAARAMTSE